MDIERSKEFRSTIAKFGGLERLVFSIMRTNTTIALQ